MQPPPFVVRLGVAAGLLFGSLAAGVVFGAVVTPRVWPLAAALIPLAVTVVCVGAWAVASLVVGAGRMATGRPLDVPGETVAEPGVPGELVSFAPGAGVMPWAGLVAGAGLGIVLALFVGGWLRTTLGWALVGAAWGSLLRALARRRLLAMPL